MATSAIARYLRFFGSKGPDPFRLVRSGNPNALNKLKDLLLKGEPPKNALDKKNNNYPFIFEVMMLGQKAHFLIPLMLQEGWDPHILYESKGVKRNILVWFFTDVHFSDSLARLFLSYGVDFSSAQERLGGNEFLKKMISISVDYKNNFDVLVEVEAALERDSFDTSPDSYQLAISALDTLIAEESKDSSSGKENRCSEACIVNYKSRKARLEEKLEALSNPASALSGGDEEGEVKTPLMASLGS